MIIVIFGVTGSGKTTIGKLLAQKKAWKFLDADDFHPKRNIQKMRKGVPLTDDDRDPWLNSIAITLRKCEKNKTHTVLACSALKETYRNKISEASKDIRWVLLHGSFESISKRLLNRSDHFMSPQLLQSQFDILEIPKNATIIDSELPPDKIVEEIEKAIYEE
ncbi:gluconokinase [bacterium]|nr:gluconokinase [bacterium]